MAKIAKNFFSSWSTVAALAAVLVPGAAVLAYDVAETCCGPGAACCVSGAPCCAGHHHAQRTR